METFAEDTAPKVDTSTMSYSEYGDFLIAQMPEASRTGTIFTKEGDVKLYLTVYICSVIGFFILNYTLRGFFTSCYNT